MGVDSTDRLLAKLCGEGVDLPLLLVKVANLASEHAVVVVGLEQLERIRPGAAGAVLSIENVYSPYPLQGVDCHCIDLENDTRRIHFVYAGVAVGGFKHSRHARFLTNVRGELASFCQPVQESFCQQIVEKTSGLITPYFHDNRKVKISFVILTGLDNAHSLRKMLISFKESVPNDPDVEVILVNNGSRDASLETVPTILGTGFRLKIVNCPENIGIAGGYNEGIVISRGDYVCLLQDDVLFTKANWHRELAYYLDNHADIGVLGGFRAGYYFRTEQYNDLEAPYLGIGSEVVGANSWLPLKQNLVEADAANCMVVMFRRELGGYDENFLPNGLEDIAFCFEARKKGFAVFVVDVGVVHDLPSATRKKRSSMSWRRFFGKGDRAELSWDPRRLSRAYHYRYFMGKYGDMLRELPPGMAASEVSLSYVEAMVEKRDRDYRPETLEEKFQS